MTCKAKAITAGGVSIPLPHNCALGRFSIFKRLSTNAEQGRFLLNAYVPIDPCRYTVF